VKTLKIDDSPLPKSKNLNVLSEFEASGSKKRASFIVVGKSYLGDAFYMEFGELTISIL
jgi:elongation factor 1 alpha-like protein